MRADLPTGTVTFLFTDIEGSTRLLTELGERYPAVLTEHRRALRQAFGNHGGVEIDTQGDAFFVAFARAPDAAAAADEAQRSLADGPVRVRIGLHSGQPTLTDEGYVGIDVHRAARICSAAHGGQIVLSEETRSLLGDALHLRDLGLHRLKDLTEPEKLFQLAGDDFPPLRTLDATNLPTQPSALVGRERELAELPPLVREERLVTLTGPGGSGKTRLALQVAAELVGEFADGVFWVPLASVTDLRLFEPTIGQTIGASDGLAEHVGNKRMLLLLDNLEQILDAAPSISALLARCPRLRVIATSRALLRIEGERDYAVDPLPEPDAVELFRERAAVSEPEEVVRAICRRLDGLPLAVELAAARTRLLSPPQLLDRLERTLPVLTGGRRDAPARQQTLRATIEWSFDLLPPGEQRLFTRLASFAGSFTVAAAEAVCDAELDALESLLEKSLLRRWESGRLGMLETIAEFATEHLEESGEAYAIRRRHADYFLELAESANLSVEALGRGPQRHDLVLPEQHNLRAALDWADDADIEFGLRLAVAVENLWVTHDPAEGMRRFEALLSRADEVDPVLRARALRGFGGTAQMAGDLERAEQAYAESGELFKAAGDEAGSATIVFRFGVAAAWRGDSSRARSLYEESLATFRRLDDAIGELQVLGNLGGLEFDPKHPERAIELIERSLELAREVGWVWWETSQLANLGEIALVAGRTADGERYAREALALARETGDRELMVYALGQLVWVATEGADEERAALLWRAIEAEEARHALPRWRMDRERYAAHLPQVMPQVPTLTLEEAADSALA
jgi:predicted ATPase/class 3 adenylate cyclase